MMRYPDSPYSLPGRAGVLPGCLADAALRGAAAGAVPEVAAAAEVPPPAGAPRVRLPVLLLPHAHPLQTRIHTYTSYATLIDMQDTTTP